MEQARRARARRQEKAAVDATQKTDRRRHRNRAAAEPAGVRAGAPAETGARAEAPGRAGANALNKLTSHRICQSTITKGGV